MAKVDFTKVEESLAHALQTTLIKKIVLGEPTVSTEAVSYYRMDDGPRPIPADPIIQALDELRKEAEELEEAARLAFLAANGEGAAKEETVQEEKKEKTAPVMNPPEKVPTKKVPTFTPLFLLRQHILWFKRKKIKDFFTTLGIQEQEIRDLRKKSSLSEEEEQKILDLLEKADDLRTATIKKLGVEDDTVYIEKERKKHITKRFKVKETWLPLDTH